MVDAEKTTKIEFHAAAMFRNVHGELFFVFKEDDKFWVIGDETGWEKMEVGLEKGELFTVCTHGGWVWNDAEAVAIKEILLQQGDRR